MQCNHIGEKTATDAKSDQDRGREERNQIVELQKCGWKFCAQLLAEIAVLPVILPAGTGRNIRETGVHLWYMRTKAMLVSSAFFITHVI